MESIDLLREVDGSVTPQTPRQDGEAASEEKRRKRATLSAAASAGAQYLSGVLLTETLAITLVESTVLSTAVATGVSLGLVRWRGDPVCGHGWPSHFASFVAAGLATCVLALLLILPAGLAPLAAWLSFVLPAVGAFLAWTHFSNLAVALEAVPEEVPGNQARVRHHYEREATRYGSPDAEGWFRWVRRRELRALVELADPRPGELALDAGCGAGAVARRLQERGARVIGVDLSPRMLARARPYLEEAVCEDFARFQLPGPVDLAVCAGALEFASDPRAAVHHLARQLRAGGRLVLLVPVAGIAGWYYRRVQGRRGMHVHLFPLGALRRWAGESGLTLRRRAFPFFHCQVLLFRR